MVLQAVFVVEHLFAQRTGSPVCAFVDLSYMKSQCVLALEFSPTVLALFVAVPAFVDFAHVLTHAFKRFELDMANRTGVSQAAVELVLKTVGLVEVLQSLFNRKSHERARATLQSAVF